MDADAPAYLLFVIGKTAVDTISDAQAKQLKVIAKAIKDERNVARASPGRKTMR